MFFTRLVPAIHGLRQVTTPSLRNHVTPMSSFYRSMGTATKKGAASQTDEYPTPNFGTGEQEHLTPEEFNARWVDFFANVDERFELYRGLNNVFAYDLIPSLNILENAIRAARRLNDFSVTVRVLTGVRIKAENTSQYESYLNALRPLLDELGIPTPEQLAV